MANVESLYLPRRSIAVFVEFTITGLGLVALLPSLFLLAGPDAGQVAMQVSEAVGTQIGWALTAHLTALLALYVSAIAGQVGDRRRIIALFGEMLAATTFPLIALLAIRVREVDGAVAFAMSLLVSIIVWFLAAQLGTFGSPPAADHIAELRAREQSLTTRIERLEVQARQKVWIVLVANLGAVVVVVLAALALTYPEAAFDLVVLSWIFLGAALLTVATWVSRLLHNLADDRYARSIAFLPAAAVHVSLALLIGIGILHWSSVYPLVVAMIGGQLVVILSGQ